MYRLIKPFLFLLPPEKAHQITTVLLHVVLKVPIFKYILKSHYHVEHPKLYKELWGLTFKNPVGLAAGFDKDANWIDDFSNLGFGFIEIGTITPKGQPGNPQPRLFRLPKDRALINRMGFNNLGMNSAIKKLKARKSSVIVGGNIGKNKITPNEEAINDYITCFEGLYDYVDYFVINVSSPNTPGLRDLQEKEPLRAIITELQNRRKDKIQNKAILLKIAPDLNKKDVESIIDLVQDTGLDGLVISNTTIDHCGLNTPDKKTKEIGNGGLSGVPLAKKSTEMIRQVRNKNSQIPIIAVGGIFSPADAKRNLDAGAQLVQVYTGLVYKGPGLIRAINRFLVGTEN